MFLFKYSCITFTASNPGIFVTFSLISLSLLKNSWRERERESSERDGEGFGENGKH